MARAIVDLITVTHPPSTTYFVRYVVIGLALTALAILFWRVGEIFVIAFGGLVLAAGLRGLSDPLAKALGWSPRLSLGVVCGALLVIALLLGWLFGSQAREQLTELQVQLPEATKKFEAWLQQSTLGRDALDVAKRSTGDSSFLSHVGLAATALVSSTANLLLIGFLGIYFAIDPRLYREGALRLLPPSRRADVGLALDDAANSLRCWLLGQMIAMIVVGVAVGLCMAIMGVPLSLLLGIFMGICEFVPVVGPIIAAIPGVLLAFSKSPEMAFYVLIAYVIVQQLESNILIPIIQRWATRLAPAIGLLAVVVFGSLFGVMGIIFATPLAVVLIAFVKHLYVEEALEHQPQTKTRAPGFKAAARRES